jgi:hypothetical protein
MSSPGPLMKPSNDIDMYRISRDMTPFPGSERKAYEGDLVMRPFRIAVVACRLRRIRRG